LFQVADLSDNPVSARSLNPSLFFSFGRHSVITLLKPQAQSCSYVYVFSLQSLKKKKIDLLIQEHDLLSFSKLTI
jgi:hypothetical protein